MIKFFRKIRHNLLMENKTGKYLKYAIGEILLVVIGILIALQINNYNNNQQQRKIEQGYLLSLKAEFETNLLKIQDTIHENTDRIKSVEDMLTLFDPTILDSVNDIKLSKMFHAVFSGNATFQHSNGVLTDIISSGNLNLIQSKQLRQGLASFESVLDFTNLQQESASLLLNKLQTQLSKHGSIRNVLIDRGAEFDYKSISELVNNREMFNMVEFENNLYDYYLTITAANSERFFIGVKEKIETILSEIDSQLTHPKTI